MPELPEVEVVRRYLEKEFSSHPKIESVELSNKSLREPCDLETSELKNASLESFSRRAKYLIMHTSRGDILAHLGMTGTWRVVDRGESKTQHGFAPQNHDHVCLHLSDGRELIYRDPRRFGSVQMLTAQVEKRRLSELGVEPLTKEFDAHYLLEKLKAKSQVIKVAIMDQAIVVGVGNIYASEALFMSGVRPTRAAGDVTKKEAEKIVTNIKKILAEAIKKGGSSIRDFHVNGQSGYAQKSFFVYGREKQDCQICKSKIKKITQAGRSTFFCSRCQPR